MACSTRVSTLIVALLFLPLPARADAELFVDNQIIVKFKTQTTRSHTLSLQSAVGIDAAVSLDLIQGELWTLAGTTVEAALEAVRSDPRVEYAEPNYLYRANATLPNDPRFGEQWGLNFWRDTDIDAPNAWDTTTGGSVLVGIIDSGVDWTHPDLADNIFVNPNEVAGNGRDDDQNGLVDDVHGWDFAYNDADPDDGADHGTHVAGIIAARGNNGVGVAGVNWTARLLPIKFLRNSGVGSTADALKSIAYARKMGVRVVNASWGGPRSIALADALRLLERDGILFVASAGNDASDYPTTFPASYGMPGIISVASIHSSGALSSFSNYGAIIDLAAPGEEILSCNSVGGYEKKSGTSMAAPHVTGAAALVWSYAPNLTAGEVKALLLGGVVRTPELEGKVKTGGRLSLKFLRALDKVAPGAVTDLHVATLESNEVTLSWTAPGDDGAAGRAQQYFLKGSVNPITDENFDSAEIADWKQPAIAGSHETAVITGLQPNARYYFALKTHDDVSQMSVLSNVTTTETTAPPELEITPASMDVALDPGEVVERTFALRNNGQGRLNVQIQAAGALRVDPATATVNPGDVLQVRVTIGTPNLRSGTYDETVWILGNNPVSTSILVHIEVRPGAHLLAPASIDFGTRYLGNSTLRNVWVQNIGNEALEVDSVFVTGGFKLGAATDGFVLAGFESRAIQVVFEPEADGPYDGELVVTSNFTSHPSYRVKLSGSARKMPIVNVATDGLHVTLATGKKTSLPITVSNDGDSLLQWTVRLVEPSNEARAEPTGVSSTEFSTVAVERPEGWTPLDEPLSVPPSDLAGKKLLEVCPWSQCCCVSTVYYDLQQQGMGPIYAASSIPASLDGIDIVYLLDSGATDVSNAAALKDWVRAGGVLMIDGFQRVAQFNELLSESAIRLTSTRFDDYRQPFPRIFPHRTTTNIDEISFDRPLLLEAGYPARVLMRDPEGHPLMAVQSVGAGMVVVVPYYAFGNFYVNRTWNDNRRFANQLFHWLFSDVRWLSTPDWKGTTGGGLSSEAMVTFDADDLPGGDYACTLELRSNDPATPVISVPVTMDVNAAPDVFVENPSVDFGSLFVGASVERKIQIWNLGSADMTLSPFEFSTPQFRAALPSVWVPPGGFGRPRFHATPGAEGVVEGSVEIGTNDPQGPISLDLRVEGLPTPSASVSDEPITQQLVDGKKSTRTIEIANGGRSGLQWSIDVAGGTDFHSMAGVRVLFGGEEDRERIRTAVTDLGAVVQRHTGVLTPEVLREHDVLVLSKAPENVDVVSAWVEAGGSLLLDIDNDIEVAAANALLSRLGNHAEYDPVPYFTFWARVANADPLIEAGVDSLFVAPSGLPVGARPPFVSLTRPFNVNGRSYPVVVRGEWGRGRVVALGGRLASDEALSKPGADNLRFITNLIEWLAPQPRWMRMFPRYGTVEPGATQRVDVTFAPVGHAGEQQTVVTVNTNDPLRPASARTVTLSTTPSPVVRIEPAVLAFGDVNHDTPFTRTVAIFNEGSQALTVSGIKVSGRGFSVNSAPLTIAPGTRHQLAVSFHPAQVAEASGELEMRTDASNASLLRVPVSGRGVNTPAIAMDSHPLAFEGMAGQSFVETVVVRNTGQSDLSFDARASLSGGVRPNGAVRVLFDLRDVDARTPAHFSTMLSDLSASGMAVTENNAPLTAQLLSSYDILWLHGAVYDWNSDEEKRAVRDWVVAGGSLLIADGTSIPMYYSLDDSLEAHVRFWENGNRATRGITSNIGAHEITNGVESVMLSRNFASLVLTHPAKLLFRDAGNEPSAACEEIGLGRIVVCADQVFHNDHLAHADTRRFANQAFAWLARPARALSVTPASGTIAPGHSVVLSVMLRSIGLVPGAYAGGIEIFHNAPGQDRLSVPVSMAVSQSPAMAIPPAIDFGGVERGTTSVLPLYVVNRGTSALQVSNIRTEDAAFTLTGRRAFSLEPGQCERLRVACRPTTRGDVTGTVIVDSNVPYADATTIALPAQGLEPPTLQVPPDTVRVTVTQGDQCASSFAIENSGDMDAVWNAAKGWLRMVEWEQGEVPLANLDGITVTYEESNGQEWVSDHWSDVKRRLERRGAFITGGNRPLDRIDEADIFWLTDGKEHYDASEMNRLVAWVKNGGALLLEGDNFDMIPEYNRILAALDAGVEFLPVEGTSGPIHDFESHEVTRGVEELESLANGAILSAPRDRARLIAKDAGGSPCVVFSTAGRGRIAVVCNELFSDECVRGRNDNHLFAQQVFGWLAYGTPWLTVVSEAGRVAPAATVQVPLKFHGDAVEAGDYVLPLQLGMESRMPATVPIHLHVARRPAVAMSQTYLEFGVTEVGKTREQPMSVTNTGTEAQTISFESSDATIFGVIPSSVYLEAGGQIVLITTYTPADSGIAQGSIRVSSDQVDGSVYLALEGRGIWRAAPLLPATFALHQNAPNPFNPATAIPYDLPERTNVTLKLYAVDGRLVKTLQDGPQEAGFYRRQWDGTNQRGERVSSGVYFCRLAAGGRVATRKLVMLK